MMSYPDQHSQPENASFPKLESFGNLDSSDTNYAATVLRQSEIARIGAAALPDINRPTSDYRAAPVGQIDIEAAVRTFLPTNEEYGTFVGQLDQSTRQGLEALLGGSVVSQEAHRMLATTVCWIRTFRNVLGASDPHDPILGDSAVLESLERSAYIAIGTPDDADSQELFGQYRIARVLLRMGDVAYLGAADVRSEFPEGAVFPIDI